MVDPLADNTPTPVRVRVPIVEYLRHVAELLSVGKPYPPSRRVCEQWTLQRIREGALPVRGYTSEGVFHEGPAPASWAWRLNPFDTFIRDDNIITDTAGVVLSVVEVCDPQTPAEEAPLGSEEAAGLEEDEEDEEGPVRLTKKGLKAKQLIDAHFAGENLATLSGTGIYDRLLESKIPNDQLPSISTFDRTLRKMRVLCPERFKEF